MKKFTYLCILSLFCVLLFSGCGNKDKYPNPNYDTENYLSGLHYVKITLSEYGDMYAVLDADAAPATVTNFIRLVYEGFYDGLTIHRVVDDFIIQGGDPDGNGTGGSAYTLPGEFSANGFEGNTISHVRGTLSMARSTDYDSASSQFFIVQQDSVALDGLYAAFGTIVSGMDYVDILVADMVSSSSNFSDSANGLIATDKQPQIGSITVLTEEEFKYLESNDFILPEENEDDNDDDFSVSMEITTADHGNDTVAKWTVNEDSEYYLISTTSSIEKISLYEFDLATMSYDEENPVATYDNLNRGELIEACIVVPEGIPSHILLIEKASGTLVRYLITYDGFHGGALLAPLDTPDAN